MSGPTTRTTRFQIGNMDDVPKGTLRKMLFALDNAEMPMMTWRLGDGSVLQVNRTESMNVVRYWGAKEVGGIIYFFVDSIDYLTQKLYVYDPKSYSFSEKATPPSALSFCYLSHCFSADSTDIYAVSSTLNLADYTKSPAPNHNTFWKYSIEADAWEQLDDPPFPGNRFPGFMECLGNYVYVGCGYQIDTGGGVPYYYDFYRYNKTDKTWETLAEYPHAAFPDSTYGKNQLISFVLNGKIYAGGGQKYTGQWSKKLACYDPLSAAWTELADLPSESKGGHCSVIDNTAHVTISINSTLFPYVTTEGATFYSYIEDSWTYKTAISLAGFYTFSAAQNIRDIFMGWWGFLLKYNIDTLAIDNLNIDAIKIDGDDAYFSVIECIDK